MRSRKKAGSDPRIPVLAGMIILLVLAAGTAGILIHRSNERRAEETAAEAEKETEPEEEPEQEAGAETKTEERQAKIVADTLPNETKAPAEVPESTVGTVPEEESTLAEESTAAEQTVVASELIPFTEELRFAEYSKIHTDPAVLYRVSGPGARGFTVCVNAGHGTRGGASVKTQCHPDGTPKVTGGSTAAGALTATAVSGGMTFRDGTPEPVVTLQEALILRDILIGRGYNVLMIRETDDVQLDNIARTVLANSYADCHIALHWDSSESDKGAFFMSVPDNGGYKNMDPVKDTWEISELLGESLIEGLRNRGVKIWSDGSLDMDLTQTSYSSVASVDIELGDRVSPHTPEQLGLLAEGLADGVELFFSRAGKRQETGQ